MDKPTYVTRRIRDEYGLPDVWYPVSYWTSLGLGVTRFNVRRALVYMPCTGKLGCSHASIPLPPTIELVCKPVPSRPSREFWIVDALNERARLDVDVRTLLWYQLRKARVSKIPLFVTAEEYGDEWTRGTVSDLIRRTSGGTSSRGFDGLSDDLAISQYLYELENTQ